MTVDKNTVLAAGQQAAIDALEYHVTEIELDFYDDEYDIRSKISDLLDNDSRRYEAYTVDYYHEAWDIVNDSDFQPDEPVDFSGCEDALSCVLVEARASTQNVVDEGWYDQIKEWAAALEDMLAEIRKLDTLPDETDSITVKLTRGSQFGYFPHSYESMYCNVWDSQNRIEGEIEGIETHGDSHDVVFYYSWEPQSE